MSNVADKCVYVDSNVLIYAVEGVPETADPAKELIRFLCTARELMFTSEIALAEVLAPSKSRGAWSSQSKRRVYMDLLIWSGAVNLIPVTRDILIHTADLRETTALKLPDAIHLASAIYGKCAFLVTGDTDFKNLPTGMTHVKPNEEEVRNLLRVLA